MSWGLLHSRSTGRCPIGEGGMTDRITYSQLLEKLNDPQTAHSNETGH